MLVGFDIDCCSVGFDGASVHAIPRSKRAINTRCSNYNNNNLILLGNLVDMSRRSLTYETRLYKYATRGFSVAVPGLSRQHIDTMRLKGI